MDKGGWKTMFEIKVVVNLFSKIIFVKNVFFCILKNIHGQVAVTLRSPQHKSAPNCIISTWHYNSSKTTDISKYFKFNNS